MLLSKLAKGVLHKKLGYNVDIQLNELNASISDEKAHVHVSIDADMSKEELNWFEKLPIHWKYIYYLVGGIIIGVMLHYIN